MDSNTKRIGKAIILYHSKTGTTRKFGEKIQEYLRDNNINSTIKSIEEIVIFDFFDYDSVFLGCWTSGLLFFRQHPEKCWVDFAKKLPTIGRRDTILFTTYKVRTGTMFKKMKEHIKTEPDAKILELKSRNGELGEQMKIRLKNLINCN